MNILETIKKLFNRWLWRKPAKIDYDKRREEMRFMRVVKGMTDQEIGDVYGITRERVRQVLGNKGKDFRKKWTRRLIASRRISFGHRTELACAPGVKREWFKDWGQHRHTPKSGAVRYGFEFEEKASVILAQNGISNELMKNKHPYDIETEKGAKVEVVVSNVDVSKMKTQTRSIYPTFAVAVRRRDCWDFLFAFIPDPSEESGYTYYVIPVSAVADLATVDGRIRIPHPPMSQKPSKWHQYHKRIDLVKNYTV